MTTPYPSLLFEDKCRTATDAIRAGESTYQFLDRLNRGNAEAYRKQANYLFSLYPEGAAKEKLWKQLMAPRASAFDEFFFELWVYNYLIKEGISVIEIEPSLPGVNTSPDFLCEKNGKKFFVEVVTIHDKPPHRQQVDLLETDLRFLCKTGWAGSLSLKQYSDDLPLPIHEIRKNVRAAIHANRTVSELTHTVRCPGWELEFKLVKNIKISDSFIRAISFNVRGVELTESIASKIRNKASKYGALEFPLIITANIQAIGLSALEHAFDAMYGREVFLMPMGPDGIPAFENGRMVREPNGVCHLSSKTENLACCLFFENAGVWRLSQPPHVSLHNPYCPLPGVEYIHSAPKVMVSLATSSFGIVNSLKYPMDSEQTWYYRLGMQHPR